MITVTAGNHTIKVKTEGLETSGEDVAAIRAGKKRLPCGLFLLAVWSGSSKRSGRRANPDGEQRRDWAAVQNESNPTTGRVRNLLVRRRFRRLATKCHKTTRIDELHRHEARPAPGR